MTASTYFLDATAVAARDAEYTGTPCTDATGDGTYIDPYLGCNRAGSCSPGIGINGGAEGLSEGAVSVNDWTLVDQHGTARTPQDGSHIGLTGLGAGDVGVGTVPINIIIAADVNNTCTLADLAVGWVNTAVV
jgi:hypothetical protein